MLAIWQDAALVKSNPLGGGCDRGPLLPVCSRVSSKDLHFIVCKYYVVR